MEAAVSDLLAWFAEIGKPFAISGIERSFAQVLESYTGAEFQVESDRKNSDYVYRSEDLIQLAGRKFHSKKNHLNSFRKNYAEAEYLPITDEIVTQCKLNINGWYKLRAQEQPDDPFMAAEREAIIEVLNNFQDFGLKGGALLVDKRVVAFTFGEQLSGHQSGVCGACLGGYDLHQPGRGHGPGGTPQGQGILSSGQDDRKIHCQPEGVTAVLYS